MIPLMGDDLSGEHTASSCREHEFAYGSGHWRNGKDHPSLLHKFEYFQFLVTLHIVAGMINGVSNFISSSELGKAALCAAL